MKLYFLGKTIKPQNSTLDHAKCLVWPETKHYIFAFKLFTPFYLLQAGKPQNKNKCFELKSWAVSLWNHHNALTAISQNHPLCLWLKLLDFRFNSQEVLHNTKQLSKDFTWPHIPAVWNCMLEKIWNNDVTLPIIFLTSKSFQKQALPENILFFFS